MSVKDHYDVHLGRIYSWMSGDFGQRVQEQLEILSDLGLIAIPGSNALDLGAGHGIQSVALASLGFSVRSIDFSKQLLDELSLNKKNLDIEVINSDILHFIEHDLSTVDLIVCMGDTLTHLESIEQVTRLIQLSSSHLNSNGSIVLSFRDLSAERFGNDRFIPVKSDDERILTCFLEFQPGYVIVHDILHEKIGNTWKQSVSSYPKLRLSNAAVVNILNESGFQSVRSCTVKGMTYLIGNKA